MSLSYTTSMDSIQESAPADEAACLLAEHLATSSILPMTLSSAIELGVFEIITKAGPGAYLSATEIASQLPTTNPHAAAMLDRILSLLACYNVLTCKVGETMADADGEVIESKYGAAPVVKFLAKDQDGVSMAPLALCNQDRVAMESWYYLKEAILVGGIAFNKAQGMPLFEYLGKDRRFNTVFNQGMRNHSTIITNKVLETYKGFGDLKSLVDVGGGVGGTIGMIVKKHPHIKAINFDLPHVIAEAQPIPGVKHVGGDMFDGVPSGDAILMKWVLHDWSDDHCLTVLKNCFKSLPKKGKVIIMENIRPLQLKSTATVQTVMHIDMIMLAHNAGGKERTEKEINSLAKKAGFMGSKLVFSYASMTVLEIYKMELD